MTDFKNPLSPLSRLLFAYAAAYAKLTQSLRQRCFAKTHMFVFAYAGPYAAYARHSCF